MANLPPQVQARRARCRLQDLVPGHGGGGEKPSYVSPSSFRLANSILTPFRRTSGYDAHAQFSRQISDQSRVSKPLKKPKTSVPKGAKLARGYVDRARTRQEEEDEGVEKIKTLEDSLKGEEIDQATFDKLRAQIGGGDVSSTSLVSGLDFKLLERVRRGEDVYDTLEEEEAEESQQETEEKENDDDAFDELLEEDVAPIVKEKREKKDHIAIAALVPGKKRTRDQMLAEMKAARAAAKARQENNLGGRFKKISEIQMPGSRIEKDSKGREVLIIIDEDGHVKRKVRKLRPEDEDEKMALLVPDKNAKPLGMEVPELYRRQQELEEDDNSDIFDDVGDDYDPLANLGSGSDSDSESGSEEGEEGAPKPRKEKVEKQVVDESETPAPQISTGPKNYFQNSKTMLLSEEQRKAPSMDDPDFKAAFKRAAALKPAGNCSDAEDEDYFSDEEAAREAKAKKERHKKMLESVDRDAEDLDMGFGMSTRYDDDDEDDGVKLSQWGDEGEGGGQKKGGKRKRTRKRKGDGNNAADVLRVIEKRREA